MVATVAALLKSCCCCWCFIGLLVLIFLHIMTIFIIVYSAATY